MTCANCQSTIGQLYEMMHHEGYKLVLSPGEPDGVDEQKMCWMQCPVCNMTDDCDGRCKEPLDL